MKKWIVITWIAALLTMTTACGTDPQQDQASSSPYLTFQDLNGATVTLEKKPERIVILNNELTELFYQVGRRSRWHSNISWCEYSC